MTGFDIWLLVSLVAMVIVAAVLGASEAALLRVQRVRLEVASEAGDSNAATMLSLLDDLPRVLNTVLLVVLLVQIGAATVAGALAARLFGSVGVTVATFVLTFVLFVYSEAIPKTYAVRHPEAVARATAPLLRLLAWFLRPVVSVLVWFADLQAPGTGIASPTAPTEEELLRLASEAAARGTIEQSDHVLMDRAFELGDQRVDDIYIPRLDVIAVPSSASVRDALDVAIANGHRRIPVYENTIDHIVGVVGMHDLASVAIDHPDRSVSSVALDPLVVPESKRVVELIGSMQRSKTHFAVVVDEFGGTAGIVTIEDIVERLVGSISSVREPASTDIEQVDGSTWIASGITDTDDIERTLDQSLPRGEWTTIAGLLIALAGHFPKTGHSIEADGLRFTVLETTPHRILSVRIERL